MTVRNLKECVTRGAAYLDENYPGWWYKIDLSELNMNDCAKCVIGQAVCDYLDWEAENVESVVEAMDLGFYPPTSYDNITLDKLWTDVVKEKFNSGELS